MIDTILTVAALALAAAYVVRKFTRKDDVKSSCGCGCSGCPTESSDCTGGCGSDEAP